MTDILGIGEALIEFVELEDSLYKQFFAGDVLNTLFYANRLGLKCEFFSTFGKDNYTKELFAFLDEEQIAYSQSGISTARNNGLYIVQTNKEGEPSFTFFRDRSAAKETFLLKDQADVASIFSSTRVLLLSSIGLAIFDEPQRIIHAIKTCPQRPLIYFDTNVRASLWNDIVDLRTWIESLSDVVDILSISKSDDEQLFGKRSTRDSINDLSEIGYKRIILRDSERSILYYSNEELHTIEIEPVQDVVDATGAGDAFNAGFLYGFLNLSDELKAIELGYRSAVQVLKERGGIVRSFSNKALSNE